LGGTVVVLGALTTTRWAHETARATAETLETANFGDLVRLP